MVRLSLESGKKKLDILVMPDEKLAQALEMFCRKFSLQVHHYVLYYNGKMLDLSQELKSTAICGNCVIQVRQKAVSVNATKPNLILVAIQFGSERMQLKCTSSTTLWEMLLQLESEQKRSILTVKTPLESNQEISCYCQPCIQYMNQVFDSNQELRQTSLALLNIFSGSGYMRLFHRPTNVEWQEFLESDRMFEMEEEKMKVRMAQAIQEAHERAEAVALRANEIRTIETGEKEKRFKPQPTEELLVEGDEGDRWENSKKKDEYDRKIDGDHMDDAEEENAVVYGMNKSSLDSHVDGSVLLYKDLDHCNDNESSSNSLLMTQGGLVDQATSAFHSFLRSLRSDDHFEQLRVPMEPIDRNIIILAPTNNPASTYLSSQDNDGDFELTPKELMDTLKQMQLNSSSGMLKTRELRATKELDNMKQFKTCIVRIRLPDQTQIQANFYTQETVGQVKQLVRSILSDRDMDFCLFTTPPRVVLDEKKSLFEQGLYPACVVMFGMNQRYTFMAPLLDTQWFNQIPIEYQKILKSKYREGGYNIIDSKCSSDQLSISNPRNRTQGQPPPLEVKNPSSRTRNSKGSNIIPKWFTSGIRKK